MHALLLGLGTALASGPSMSAELDPSTGPEVRAAACAAGFQLGPCGPPPCVRVDGDVLEVRHPDGAIELIALDDPATSFTLALSRLTLGPLLGGPAATDTPERSPSEPRPVPRDATGASPRQATQPSPPTWPTEPRSRTVEPRPVPATPVELRVQSPAVVQVPRSRPLNAWFSGAVGAGTGLQLAAETGVSRGAWLVGVGTWVDGAVVFGAGTGLTSPGRLQVSGSAWLGAEHRPRECMVCNVDVQTSETGTVTHQKGLLPSAKGPSGWGPAGRAMVGVAYRFGPRFSLGPRIDATLTPHGLRLVGAMAAKWSSR